MRPAFDDATTPVQYLWDCPSLGACLTSQRMPFGDGRSMNRVTLWLVMDHDDKCLRRGLTRGLKCRATTDGDLRWWLTLEFAPLVDDEQLGIRGLVDDHRDCDTIEDITTTAQELALDIRTS